MKAWHIGELKFVMGQERILDHNTSVRIDKEEQADLFSVPWPACRRWGVSAICAALLGRALCLCGYSGSTTKGKPSGHQKC